MARPLKNNFLLPLPFKDDFLYLLIEVAIVDGAPRSIIHSLRKAQQAQQKNILHKAIRILIFHKSEFYKRFLRVIDDFITPRSVSSDNNVFETRQSSGKVNYFILQLFQIVEQHPDDGSRGEEMDLFRYPKGMKHISLSMMLGFVYNFVII